MSHILYRTRRLNQDSSLFCVLVQLLGFHFLLHRRLSCGFGKCQAAEFCYKTAALVTSCPSFQSSWAFSCDCLCSFREFCSSTAPEVLMLLPQPTTSESDSLGFRSVPTCPLCRAFICKHCSDTAGSLSSEQELSAFF